jgi:hypothetical protein
MSGADPRSARVGRPRLRICRCATIVRAYRALLRPCSLELLLRALLVAALMTACANEPYPDLLNACDGTVCTFPEDPEFDAYATFDALPVFGVSGVVGLILNAGDRIRAGVSLTLPYTLRMRRVRA